MTKGDTLTDAEVDLAVLAVLAGQSADYLIHPDASAFFAEGLSADQVSAALARQAAAGYAREDEVVLMTYTPEKDDAGDDIAGSIATDPATGDPVLTEKRDESGNPIVVASGWCITDEGRTEAAA